MRHPALLLIMGSLLLIITSFASPELLRALAIDQESKQTGQILLVEGPQPGAVQSSPSTAVPPAPPASETEQKEQASGDVQERGLKDTLSEFPTKEQILTAPLTTTTAPCPVTLPATPPNPPPGWAYDILTFQGSINLQVPGSSTLLPSPYWRASNGSNACQGCAFFGTSLWKSKVGGGSNNTAFGAHALYENNCGRGNTAIGNSALDANISGYENTGMGMHALGRNTSGNHNTAVGYAAGFDQFTGSNNVYIDNPGQNGESNTIRIGRTSQSPHTRIIVAGINTASITGIPVEVIGGDVPQLGIRPSSRRYKEDIHDLGKASKGLQRLRPVAFRYKADAVAGGGAQDYGLIAEEVAEVYPELVGRNTDGEIITVHYQKLIPMLLNELQQQQNINQQQQRKNDELEARLAKLESK